MSEISLITFSPTGSTLRVAQALANIKLPTYVVAGGNGGNGNTAMDAMGLKMMTDLVNQMSK